MSNTVLYDKQDHIAMITLNRPERLNALNREAYQAGTDMFRRANEDSDVRCIVFTGAGRSFCSGDDVAEIMGSGDGLAGTLGKQSAGPATPAIVTEIQNSRCPIVCAVNGAAVGFGMELTLLCDIRIASETARFSEMFIRRGIIATAISYDLLPDIVGPAMAAELLLTGELIDAEQALDISLVSKVVNQESLVAEAVVLATNICANAPLAVQRAKKGLQLRRERRIEEMEHHLNESLRFLSGTRDHKESVAAFLEKRNPVYTGE